MENSLERLSQLQIQLTNGWVEYWRQYNWGTWEFWSLVILTALTLILWWKLVDKKRFVPIILIGLIINTLNLYLDAYGTQYSLWTYKYQIFPTLPTAFSLNFVLIPVAYMLLYQYADTWRKYIPSLIALALIIAYPMQLFAKMINFYEDFQWWNSNWSFLVLITMGIVTKLLVDKSLQIQESRLDKVRKETITKEISNKTNLQHAFKRLNNDKEK